MVKDTLKVQIYILLTLCLAGSQNSWCQENNILINRNWDHERHAWASSWISHPTASPTGFGVFNLRNSFLLDSIPETLTMYVSADNRYRLLVNGQEVCTGPARGSLMYWRYETIDVAPYLKAGRNIIAAEVHNLGQDRPAALFSYQTAFICQAGDGYGDLLNTPGNWLIYQNQAITPIKVTPQMVKGYYVAGPTQQTDGSLYPWGWESPDYDDSGWLAPEVVTLGVGRGYMHGVPWLLVPRNIPFMEKLKEEISLVRRTGGIKPHPDFTLGEHPLTIPPGSSCKILLDQSYLTTTYPNFQLSGGRGSSFKVTYAEALYGPDGMKGNRDETDGKKILGYFDVILPDGGSNRTYTTLATRTYRYMQLEVTTGDEPLTIQRIYGMFTAYPFKRLARVETSDPFLDQVQDIGWRTARLCAAETYMDCPYYEQLQYLGDTRIQSLISLYLSGDDRLMRNCLLQADHSRLPEGLTLSRAPSAIPQIIPPFSLYWIAMVHDYHMHRQDDAFVEAFLPGIEAVLGWFERRMREDGLLGGLDWLNFTDWTRGFMVGSPPGVDLGGSALITLNYAYALDRAADLYAYFNKTSRAEQLAGRADQIRKDVFRLCFNPQRGLLADTPEQIHYSQHSNIFGILTKCIPPDLQSSVMESVLADTSLVQTTIYYRFYLFQAMEKAALGSAYLEHLGPWKEMIDKGLTTWEEGDYEERSDCHAWGSSPNYHLLSIVCGIRPASPGFRQISITPHLGSLSNISASMPHPNGNIKLTYKHKPGQELQARISLPPGTEGTLSWGGKSRHLKPGENQVNLKTGN